MSLLSLTPIEPSRFHCIGFILKSLLYPYPFNKMSSYPSLLASKILNSWKSKFSNSCENLGEKLPSPLFTHTSKPLFPSSRATTISSLLSLFKSLQIIEVAPLPKV